MQQEEQPTFAAAASTWRPICGSLLAALAWTRDTWRQRGLRGTAEGATALASIVRFIHSQSKACGGHADERLDLRAFWPTS